MIEAGWLLAVALVPIIFDLDQDRSFDLPKVAVVRTLAILMLLGHAIRFLERPGKAARAAQPAPALPPHARPVLVGAALMLATQVISALGSIAPHDSWFGSYLRISGVLTSAAYLVVFASVLLLMRTAAQWRRLANTVLGVSFAVSAYAFVQWLGADPLPSGQAVSDRPFSTLGNAISLGAVNALALPIALARIWELLAQKPAREIAVATHVGIVMVQLLGLVVSDSRGPMLALGASLALAGLVVCLARGRARWAVGALAVTIVAGSVALASPLRARLQGRWSAPGALVDADGSRTNKEATSRVRLEIWKIVADTMHGKKRVAIGFGPDTQRVTLSPNVTQELERAEARNGLPDRSHNQTLDVLLESGVLGVAAYLGFFIVLFGVGLRRLGLLEGRRQAMAFYVIAGVGTVVPPVALRFIDHSIRFGGLAAALGMAGAIFLFLGARAIRSARGTAPASTAAPIAALLVLAVLFGHFAETQVAFGVPSTLVVFWVCAAAMFGLRDSGTAIDKATAQAEAADEARAPFVGGVLTGSVLGVFAFNLASSRVASVGVLAIALGLVVWVVWLLLWTDGRPGGGLAWHGGGTAAAVVLALILRALGDGPEGTGIGLVLLLLVVVVFVALAVALGRGANLAGADARRPVVFPLALAGIAMTVVWNGDAAAMRADAAVGRARQVALRGDPVEAIELSRRATEIAPGQATYHHTLGRALGSIMDLTERAEDAALVFDEAEAAFARATDLAPLDPDIASDRADLHYAWAVKQKARPKRLEIANTAALHYSQALTLRPTSGHLYSQRCLVYLMQNNVALAQSDCRRSLAFGPHEQHARVTLGQIAEAFARNDEALAWYASVDKSSDAKPEADRLKRRLEEKIQNGKGAQSPEGPR